MRVVLTSIKDSNAKHICRREPISLRLEGGFLVNWPLWWLPQQTLSNFGWPISLTCSLLLKFKWLIKWSLNPSLVPYQTGLSRKHGCRLPSDCPRKKDTKGYQKQTLVHIPRVHKFKASLHKLFIFTNQCFLYYSSFLNSLDFKGLWSCIARCNLQYNLTTATTHFWTIIRLMSQQNINTWFKVLGIGKAISDQGSFP